MPVLICLDTCEVLKSKYVIKSYMLFSVSLLQVHSFMNANGTKINNGGKSIYMFLNSNCYSQWKEHMI